MKTIKCVMVIGFILMHSVLFSQSNNADVDKLVEDFMKKWELPGGQFAMALNGNIIYSKGYGYANAETKEAVTTSSLFRIASCTKPFTSVAIMQLIEQGKLQLADKVFGANGILNEPEFRTIKDKRVLNVTINELLTHTGGWDSNIEGDPMFMSVQIAEAEKVTPPAMQNAIIRYVLANMELNHAPGTTYAYSNFGYCVLGRVLEKITGKAYGEHIHESILNISGSQTMRLGKNLANEKFNNEVSYYGCTGEMTTTSVYGNGQTVPWPYGGFNIQAMDSHGEWIASAEDLVKFLVAVGNNSLISENSYKIMTTVPGIKNDTYAKGWAVNGGNIWHTGSLPGTATEIVKATNGYAWALLFNKRSLNNDIWSDLDNLGWNAQKYLK